MSSKAIKARGAARLAAVQALYQMDVGQVSLDDVLREFEDYRFGKETDGVTFRDADPEFFHKLTSGVVAEQRTLDPKIHAALKDWPLARIDTTLRAILRAATQELAKHDDVPARVVISEYVGIAKAFFDGDEPRITNGVLDAIARGLRPEEFPAESATGG